MAHHENVRVMRHEKKVGGLRAVMVAVSACALVGAGAISHALVQGHATPPARTQTSYDASRPQMSFADLADRVKPAVVSVQTHIVEAAAPDEAMPFGDLFGRFGLPFEALPAPPREGMAQGSGFFVSADGYIVTNNHVIRNARDVRVTMDDGKTVEARVVATDPRTDLALLKTKPGGNYPFVRFAKSAPRVGDWVVAVGNPFGLGGTVTAGIVSARGRDIGEGPYDDFLQIDAPVNRGNSGGPTFNLDGEVVGVNTAIYSPSGGNVGIAFAIPASVAEPIVDSLRQGRAVERGYLGASLQALDDALARSLGLPDTKGALVADVSVGGPANRAGIRNGDVIVRAGNTEISNTRDLARVVGSQRPASPLRLQLVRDGRRMELSVTLGAAPRQSDS
jgi:serine protease Do